MWTMAKIRDGATYLGNHLAANDYYAEGESVTGQWQGRLAEEWQLAGKAIAAGDEVFERLRAGVTPDGAEPLRQRMRQGTKEGGAVCFFDFQVSAQKSVSVASLFDDRLVGAHDRAAAEAFRELETFAARRINGVAAGPGNWLESTGKVCAAVFRHDASRELDPQLHTHHVVANVTLGADGKRYGLTERQMVEAIRFAGKAYQNALARECQALGYATREKRDAKGSLEGFELAHVSDGVCERFSQRRAQIEAGIADFQKARGRPPTAAERGIITRETRSKKLGETTTPAVRAGQLARFSSEERAVLVAAAGQARTKGAVQEAREDEDALVARALDHTFERASVANGHQILAEALNGSLGRMDLTRAWAALETRAVRLSEEPAAQATFTTRDNLEREQWSARFVGDACGSVSALRESLQMTPGLEALAPEQRDAVQFICATRDRVVSVRGVAGAGKTTMLQELDRQLGEHARVLYLAPTRGAVEVLRKEGFADATTVADYLIRSQIGKEPEDWRGALVVVDEAGLQSTRQGSDVLRLAQRHGNRVAFVGDTKQHTSVEAGDFVRMLEACSQMDRRELVSIRRQLHADYRLAVSAMQRGEHAAGVEQLDRLGWVKEGGPDYLQNAADAYLARARENQSVLLIAPTWAENQALTDRIRATLRAEGKLGAGTQVEVEESLNLTKAQRSDPRRYQVGQVIHFTADGAGAKRGTSATVREVQGGQVRLSNGEDLQLTWASAFEVYSRRQMEVAPGDKLLMRANLKKAGLTNGEVLTVAFIETDGTIQTAEGKALPSRFRRFGHGYSVTSHKSQGVTCDHVVVAAARLDGKAAYVATSRGRQSCEIHTPQKEHLLDGLARSGERASALETIRERQARRGAPRPYGTRGNLPGEEAARKQVRKSPVVAAGQGRKFASPAPLRARTHLGTAGARDASPHSPDLPRQDGMRM